MLDLHQRKQTVDPAHAEEVVYGFCEALGLPCCETFTASEASELARALEYDAQPATVHEFARKNYFAPNDCNALSPTEMFCFLNALDSRRRWKKWPSERHDWRKSSSRLLLERIAAKGEEQPISDLDAWSIEDLLIWIATDADPDKREAYHEILRAKLAGFEE